MTLDKYKLDNIIFNWVEKNYGRSEALEPSWSITDLANEIAEKYDKPLEEEPQPYELTLLVRKDTTLSEMNALHTTIMRYFEDGEACKRWENDGVKRLACEIKGEKEAGYFWVEGSMKYGAVVNLSKILDDEHCVLRYLLVSQEKPKGM